MLEGYFNLRQCFMANDRKQAIITSFLFFRFPSFSQARGPSKSYLSVKHPIFRLRLEPVHPAHLVWSLSTATTSMGLVTASRTWGKARRKTLYLCRRTAPGTTSENVKADADIHSFILLNRLGSSMVSLFRLCAKAAEPDPVAQIEFTEWTPDGHLRHSRFVGLREDKEARNVVREIES